MDTKMTILELKLLSCLLESSAAVNSETLAKCCNVSKSTVRNTISVLNQKLEPKGVHITSKPSMGYQLSVTEENHAEPFFADLKHQLNSPLFDRSTNLENKANYIIRRLLSASSYISKRTLCQELFYSETFVEKGIKKADHWLQDFGLRIKVQKNRGYYIDGNEWMKRICLLEQHKLFINLPKDLRDNESEYQKAMGITNKNYQQCLPLIVEQIRKGRKALFKLIELPILVNYIPLIETRKKYTGQIYFSDEQREALQKSGMIEESRRILGFVKDIIEITDAEVEAYAMLLLNYRSLTDYSQLAEGEISVLRKDTLEIIDFFQEQLCFYEEPEEKYIKEFSYTWYRIKNRIISGIIPDEENDRPVASGDFLIEDLCAKFAQFLEKKYQRNIDIRQTIPMYFLLKLIFNRKLQNIFHYRLLVISIYGYEYSRYAAALIRDRYSFFIKETDVLQHTEMTEELYSQYDFFVTDARADMRPKLTNCHTVSLEFLNNQKQTVPDLDSYFNEKLKREKDSVVQYFHLPTKGKTREEILRMIATDLNEGSADKETLSMLLWRPRYVKKVVYKETLYLNSEKMEDGIRIYQCSSRFKWDGENVNRIVCYSYSFEHPEALFYISEKLRDILLES